MGSLVAVLEKLTHKNAGLMVSLRALIVPVLATARAGGSASFLHGDALPMMRRVQHSGQRTEWSEVPHRIAPRFGVDRTVLLEALPADHPDTEPYKVSLALLGLEFTTPWITLSDGSGRYLERLDLRLTSSGDTLSAMSYTEEHVEAGGEFAPPLHISLHYTWGVADEHDLGAALTLLFVVATAAVGALVAFTCARHGAPLAARLAGDGDGGTGDPNEYVRDDVAREVRKRD